MQIPTEEFTHNNRSYRYNEEYGVLQRRREDNWLTFSPTIWIYTRNALTLHGGTTAKTNTPYIQPIVFGHALTEQPLDAPIHQLQQWLVDHYGRLPLDNRHVAELDAIATALSHMIGKPEPTLDLELFGHTSDREIPGFFSKTASVINGIIYPTVEDVPDILERRTQVTPSEHPLSAKLELRDAPHEDIEAALHCLLSDMLRYFPDGSTTLLLGLAAFSPYPTRFLPGKPRAIAWLYGPPATGKTYLAHYLMQMSGPSFNHTDQLGVTSTPNAIFAALSYFSSAMAILDDVNPRLFQSHKELAQMLNFLHATSMGRLRERADARGKVSRITSTPAVSSLFITSEIHPDDVRMMTPALRSRILPIYANPSDAITHAEVTRNLTLHSPNFSAIMLHLIQYQQTEKIAPKQFYNQTKRKLTEAIADHHELTGPIMRQIDILTYSYAGLLLLKGLVDKSFPRLTPDINNTIREFFTYIAGNTEQVGNPNAIGISNLFANHLADLLATNQVQLVTVGNNNHSGFSKLSHTPPSSMSLIYEAPNNSKPIIGFRVNDWITIDLKAFAHQVHEHLRQELSTRHIARALHELKVPITENSTMHTVPGCLLDTANSNPRITVNGVRKRYLVLHKNTLNIATE